MVSVRVTALGFLILFLVEPLAVGAPPEHVSARCIKMEFTWIPGGKFEMGNRLSRDEFVKAAGRRPGFEDGYLQHGVEIDPFYIGTTEVTVAQFRSFVHDTKYQTTAERVKAKCWWNRPEFKQGDRHPVIYVSYEDALAFVEWMSLKDRILYRLPTEAEWEFAAWGGSVDEFPWNGPASDASRYGNFKAPGSANRFTLPVKSLAPNGYGVYDMLGNVWEWCSDWADDPYSFVREKNPTGPASGTLRAYRGGSWEDVLVLPTVRNHQPPKSFYRNGGFRVARDVDLKDHPWQQATLCRWTHLTRRELLVVCEIGQDVPLGDVRWKVLRVEPARRHSENSSTKVVQVEYEIENRGSEPKKLAVPDVFDDQGRRFEAAYDLTPVVIDKLNPGIVQKLTVAYKTPNDPCSLILAVEGFKDGKRMQGVVRL